MRDVVAVFIITGRFVRLEQGGCVGIDAGGTLIKLAYVLDGTLVLKRYVADDIKKAAEFVEGEFPEAQLCITGGKSLPMQSLFAREARRMVEFEATCSGVRYLLAKEGLPLESFVLTNVGTGTSIHHVTNGGHSRIGGTGVGGGTLLGLSALLTGIADYSEIVRRSQQGSREAIDLKVSHIYEGAEPPISGELTASNFGRVPRLGLGRDAVSRDMVNRDPVSDAQGDPVGASGVAGTPGLIGAPKSIGTTSGSEYGVDDLLASVVGLVGETVATSSVLAAGPNGAHAIVYIGSSFVDNPLLARIVSDYTRLRGAVPVMLQDGAFSGAIGALQALRELPPTEQTK
jgi:type II pantothenate kinase